MEISDGQPPQDQSGEKPLPPPVDITESIFERDVKKAFRGALKPIHVALVTYYQIAEEEACDLEKDLFLWFHNFCRRPGHSPVSDAVPFLLLFSCQFAREYKQFILESQAIKSNRKLRLVLSKEPKKVARTVARKLKLRLRFPDV